jgi:proline-specific peptidase
VHLFGHSWGGWLAIEYLLGNPAGVTSAVLGSTSASCAEFVDEAAKLKAQLPDEVRRVMHSCEAAGDFADPAYQEAVMEFYRRHLCRVQPWPDCLMRSIENIDGNPVYLTMNGPNEFTVVGNLKNWDRRDRIHEIRIPVLVTLGRYDEIPLACAQTLHRHIGGSELAIFEQSSHMAMLEETEAYVNRIADFLKRRDYRVSE